MQTLRSPFTCKRHTRNDRRRHATSTDVCKPPGFRGREGGREGEREGERERERGGEERGGREREGEGEGEGREGGWPRPFDKMAVVRDLQIQVLPLKLNF